MLILSAVIAVLAYGLMSPLLGVLLPTYSLTPSQQGSLGLVNALGLVAASLSSGPLIDLKGPKIAMVTGLSIMCLALLALPNAAGFTTLLSAFFAIGIGGGIVSTASNSLVAGISSERRGPALNFLNLFFGLGGIITTYCASYAFTPPTICYFIGCLTLTALLVNASVRNPCRRTDQEPGESQRPRRARFARVTSKRTGATFQWTQVRSLLAHGPLFLLAVSMFLYVACEVGVWNWLKLYLISRNFPPQTAGGIVSYGFALGILLGRILVSRILAFASAMNVLLISGLTIAATTFTMLHVSSQLAVTLAVFSAGLAMAPVFPTTLALVGDHYQRATATAIGMVITAGWLGLAVSSPLIGKLGAQSTLQRALLLLPLLAVAMVLVNLVLRSTLREGHQK